MIPDDFVVVPADLIRFDVAHPAMTLGTNLDLFRGAPRPFFESDDGTFGIIVHRRRMRGARGMAALASDVWDEVNEFVPANTAGRRMAFEASFESRATNDTSEVLNVVLNGQPQLPGCEIGLIHAAKPRDAVFDTGRNSRAIRGQRHKGDCVVARSKRELQRKPVTVEQSGNGHINPGFRHAVVKRRVAFQVVKFQMIKSIPQWKIASRPERSSVTAL